MNSDSSYIKCNSCDYLMNEFSIEAMLEGIGEVRCFGCRERIDDSQINEHLEEMKNKYEAAGGKKC